MTKSTLLDKYPIYSLNVKKSETKFTSVDEIINHFKTKIEQDPNGSFINIFDHLAHTSALNGEIFEGLKAAKSIIYCFGIAIPNTKILAARPRSIAVCELEDSFAIECMDAPREVMQSKITSWIKSILN
ncbi:MAG: hypothetical protein GX780_06015 [Campylobacteraceae bacterium]|nr:hypothetical protein [Campylobacteraceae bacterium]